MASYGHPSLPFASSLVANRHPRATHQWLLMGVQVCRLPALKPLKRSKRLKRSKPLQTVQPVKRWLRVLPLAAISYPGHTSMASSGHSCSQPPPQGHTSMASYGHSCSQQAPQGHTSMASYGHPSLPFASSLAANRHPRATHQWLLMGVQVCRLPALKPISLSLSPQDPPNRMGRRHLGASPFYIYIYGTYLYISIRVIILFAVIS